MLSMASPDMASPDVTSPLVHFPPSTMDLDPIISRWAKERLHDGEVEKIDTSDVKVIQMGVAYQGDQDWFRTRIVNEEIFDNPADTSDSTWQYAEIVTFSSSVTWTIQKGFKSSLLPKMSTVVEFPVADDSGVPLKAVFQTLEAGVPVEAKSESEWKVKAEVNVKPFSTTRVTAQVRTCRLRRAQFTTDVILAGLVRISGKTGSAISSSSSSSNSKKPAKAGKHIEVTASIADALADTPGFTVAEDGPLDAANADTYESLKRVSFCVNGSCKGEVGLGASVKQTDVQSLV